MPAHDDAQLMLRFQRDGDWTALERLFERNRGALLRFLTRLSRNRTVAEDVAQQTWLKVIDVANQGAFAAASGVAFRTWLCTLARNHFIDHYRKYKTEKTRTTPLEDHFDIASSPTTRIETPAEVLDRKEAADRVHRLLQRLPADQREAVILRDLEELTYEEIAEMLNLPIGTVKSRINRGRIELARLVKTESL